MRPFRTALRAAVIPAALIASASFMRADPSDQQEIQSLRDQLQALSQQVKVLARQIEIKEEAAAAAPPTTPTITVNDKGLNVTSADGKSTFHLGGLVQFDSREYFGDSGTLATPGVTNNTFILRRARINADGTFNSIYSFQLVTEFGGGSLASTSGGNASNASAVSILDANLNIAPTKELQFKFGKFKSPVGLEFLQADSALLFVERSLVNNLVPQRDLGAQAWGVIDNGVLTYSVGLYGGVADLANTANVDFDNDKDGIVRVFAQPFVNDKDSALQGLGFGVSADVGRQKGVTPASTTTTYGVAQDAGLTAGYKTDGQQTFFKYGTAVQDGAVYRISPQAYYYNGPFSLLSEYVVSTVNVRNQALLANPPTKPSVELKNTAWEVQGGYVLTGENSTFGGVTPAEPFNWQKGTWGAWQVVARYAEQSIDKSAFPTFAATTTNAQAASAFGLGLNWYLSGSVRVATDYFQTSFTLPPGVASSATEILNHDEKALITRFQVSF